MNWLKKILFEFALTLQVKISTVFSSQKRKMKKYITRENVSLGLGNCSCNCLFENFLGWKPKEFEISLDKQWPDAGILSGKLVIANLKHFDGVVFVSLPPLPVIQPTITFCPEHKSWDSKYTVYRNYIQSC